MSAEPSPIASAGVGDDKHAAPKIRLLFEEGASELDSVALSHEDAFSLETLGELVSRHAVAGKRLIVARVKTRDGLHVFGRLHHSYYAAHALNKLLFRMRHASNDLVSRYSRTRPIAAVNPLTNTEIVGEVMYFMVGEPPLPHLLEAANEPHVDRDADVSADAGVGAGAGADAGVGAGAGAGVTPASRATAVSSSSSSSSSLSMSDASAGVGLARLSSATAASSQPTGPATMPAPAPQCDMCAYFIGTDYHYVHNHALRLLFARNALAPEDMMLQMEAAGGGANAWRAGLPVQLGIDGPLDVEMLQALAELNADGLRQELTVPFSQAIIYGAVCMMYLILLLTVVSTGVRHLAGQLDDTERESAWFWCLLPLATFVVDRATVHLFGATETRAVVAVKLALWIVYIVLPPAALHTSAKRFLLARDILDLLMPIAALVHSASLYFAAVASRLVT